MFGGGLEWWGEFCREKELGAVLAEERGEQTQSDLCAESKCWGRRGGKLQVKSRKLGQYYFTAVGGWGWGLDQHWGPSTPFSEAILRQVSTERHTRLKLGAGRLKPAAVGRELEVKSMEGRRAQSRGQTAMA